MSSIESQLIKCIKDQTTSQRDDEVYVIEIEGIQTKNIPKKVQNLLERFEALQLLSMNNCGIEDLSNFPENKALIRLDLINNNIDGNQLAYLQKIRHLQTLFLGHNNINEISELNSITHFKKLIQLDLINNDICDIANYRQKVFEKFPTLKILDNENKEGHFYQGKALVESAQRVNANLFEKPSQSQSQSIFGGTSIFAPKTTALAPTPLLKKKSTKLTKKPTLQQALPPIKVGPRFNKVNSKTGKGKAGKIAGKTKKSSNFTRYNLEFPVGRITRYLKEKLIKTRIGKNAGIFMAAVLEYLTAEVLELAGHQTKLQKRIRIMPKDISTAIKFDDELNQICQDLTISEGGFLNAYSRTMDLYTKKK